MTYVKLIAKPDTWFKPFTEVYHYDAAPARRLTVDEWSAAVCEDSVCVRGLRVNEHPRAEGGGTVGDEYEDGEYCQCDEFHLVCQTKEATPNKCPHPQASLVYRPYGNDPQGKGCCALCDETLMIGTLFTS